MSVVALVQSTDVLPATSGLVIDDVDQARELTARTREALHTAAAAVEAALTLVAEARDTRAWAVLGYKSFAAYAEVELVGLREVKLSIDRRVALVRGLVDQGLSRRGVGRIAGCSDQTVRADLERAMDEEEVVEGEVIDETPARTLTQPELALTALGEAGLKGLTEVEVARRYRSWKAPWAVFSRLHTQGRIARLAVYEPSGTREHKGAKHAVYVALEHLEGRDAEQPGRQRGVTLMPAIAA